ncbi:hypothetical protein N656DRAFT_631538 [Canariomyces notabilis]|uniref:Uncharacterized protein n=1 Tax=Canariomyces notabilis TaxID=2074819 RepID=A0AAN6YTH5_9PEZI|nr:hypothetical protein N656DRAFT_631538 [Canariomyces arenarius]
MQNRRHGFCAYHLRSHRAEIGSWLFSSRVTTSWVIELVTSTQLIHSLEAKRRSKVAVPFFKPPHL